MHKVGWDVQLNMRDEDADVTRESIGPQNMTFHGQHVRHVTSVATQPAQEHQKLNPNPESNYQNPKTPRSQCPLTGIGLGRDSIQPSPFMTNSPVQMSNHFQIKINRIRPRERWSAPAAIPATETSDKPSTGWASGTASSLLVLTSCLPSRPYVGLPKDRSSPSYTATNMCAGSQTNRKMDKQTDAQTDSQPAATYLTIQL